MKPRTLGGSLIDLIMRKERRNARQRLWAARTIKDLRARLRNVKSRSDLLSLGSLLGFDD
jgi:hypothetical protein